MICEICGVNIATVHVEEIVGEDRTVVHMCSSCAERSGISLKFDVDPSSGEESDASFDSNGDDGSELSSMINKKKEKGEEGKKQKDVRCPKCRLSIKEFREKGLLGCSYCYTAFESEISDIFVQIHGSKKYKGRGYDDDAVLSEDDIKFLRSELKTAVENEEFELAAAIRDKINASRISNEKS